MAALAPGWWLHLAHIGHQPPSRVQPSAKKAHATHPHSSSRCCSGCRDPMRQSSSLACSPRDTGHGSEVVLLLDRRPPPLPPSGSCFPASDFSEAAIFSPTGTWQAPDSGQEARVTSSSKGTHCAPCTLEERHAHGEFLCPLPHSFLKASAVLY